MLNFERLCGPSWARTSDPLIISVLFSICYSVRKSQDIRVIFNINKDLGVYTIKINCSFIVKFYIDSHGFAGKLAKKLAPSLKIQGVIILELFQ